MCNEQTDDLQRQLTHAALGDNGNKDHAVHHKLSRHGEEPDHDLLAALVLVGGVTEGYEEGGEKGVGGPGDEWCVAPRDFIQGLIEVSLSSSQCLERYRENEKRLKRCRALKTTRASMRKPAEPSI